MINDFKFGLKIIKYGLNVKGSIIVSIFFLILGIIMDFTVPYSPINGIYVGMGGMMIVQMICSVSVSTMVQSSEHKRQIQTSVPVIVCGGYLLVGNTISILTKLVGMHFLEWNLSEISNGIVINAVLMAIIALYMAGAFKFFKIATGVFFLLYLAFFFLASSVNYMEEIELLPFEIAVVFSYMMIIVAMVLMYLLFVAMYKRDYSKQTFETLLKRAK